MFACRQREMQSSPAECQRREAGGRGSRCGGLTLGMGVCVCVCVSRQGGRYGDGGPLSRRRKVEWQMGWEEAEESSNCLAAFSGRGDRRPLGVSGQDCFISEVILPDLPLCHIEVSAWVNVTLPLANGAQNFKHPLWVFNLYHANFVIMADLKHTNKSVYVRQKPAGNSFYFSLAFIFIVFMLVISLCAFAILLLF